MMPPSAAASRRPLARLGATWLLEQPIAHRGLHGPGAPENSLAAFAAAVEAKLPIELDVRSTADGEVVVFHDPDLGRMTGHAGAVAQADAASLRRLRLRGSSQPIPTLDEVLEAVAGRVPVLVELKTRGPGRSLEQSVLRRLQRYRGPVAVQSFDPMSIAWFAQRAPDVPRGLLACRFEDAALSRIERFVLARLLLGPHARPHFVGYDVHSLPWWPAAAARRLGVPLLAWTIRTEDDLQRARAHADNVIFEGLAPSAVSPASG